MHDETDASQPRKRALGAELVIPVAALVIAVRYALRAIVGEPPE